MSATVGHPEAECPLCAHIADIHHYKKSVRKLPNSDIDSIKIRPLRRQGS